MLLNFPLKPSKTDICMVSLWALRLVSTQLRGLGSDPFGEPEPERENRWLKAGWGYAKQMSLSQGQLSTGWGSQDRCKYSWWGYNGLQTNLYLDRHILDNYLKLLRLAVWEWLGIFVCTGCKHQPQTFTWRGPVHFRKPKSTTNPERNHSRCHVRGYISLANFWEP